MEIQENNNVVKYLKQNIENTVDKILSKHTDLNINADITTKEFDDIIDNIIKSKEINNITQQFCDDYELSEVENRNFVIQFDKLDLHNESKYENLVQQLTQNKSVDIKLKLLKALIKYPVLDMIDKYKWPKLSKSLRECLSSRHKDMFTASFKVHVKLSNNPQTVIEASINLIKSLSSMFQCRKMQCPYSDGIDLRNSNQEHIIKITHLLLHNFKTFKSYNSRDKSTENVLISFMELMNMHTLNDKSEHFNFTNYLSVFDTKAKWFSELTHNTTNKKVLVNFLAKNPLFIKYLIKEVITTVNINENEGYLKKISKSELNQEMVKIATFSHCANIVCHLLCYKWGQKLFPVEAKSNDKPIYSIIVTFITAINNLSSLPKQSLKRQILIQALLKIIIKNRHFLKNKDIFNLLIKPFLSYKIQDKQKFLEIARKNIHILHIINDICNTKDGFCVIFGYAIDGHPRSHRRIRQSQYIRSISLPEPYVISTLIDKHIKLHRCSSAVNDRENISYGKIIVDYTTTLIRHYINVYETLTVVDDILYELFECCCNILSTHSHALYLVESEKLIAATKNLYQILIDRNLLVNSMNPILKFLLFICESKRGIDHYSLEDEQLLYTICKNYYSIPNIDFWNNKCFPRYFINLANTAPGCKAILECEKTLIAPHLNKLWKTDEDQIIFVTGSNIVIEEQIFEFMKIVFTLSFSFNCIQALLSNDTDDESTLIDSDKHATNLRDLIDDSLNTSGPGTLPCYLGLYTIKMLINNLNILVFLQNMTNLKDQLQTLQAECKLVSGVGSKATQPDNEIIVDECSSLRQSIINTLESIGTMKYSQVVYKTMRQTRMQSSSVTPSARNRRLNEFQRFLNDSRNNLHDQSWLIQARKIYKQTCGLNFKESVFIDLIQQVRLTIPVTKSDFIWPDNESKLDDLFPEDLVGISMIIRFGLNNKILQSSFQCEDVLALLLKQVNSFLSLNRVKFNGFDWFVGVIFLMSGGNIERSKITLQCMVHLPVAPYIWPSLGVQLGLNRKFMYASHFDHTLNVLMDDMEIFKPAIECAGISWNALTTNWLNQCFFNVLEWSELCNYMALSILFPTEYVLFYIICCVQYLEPKIFNSIICTDIAVYQKIFQLDGFHINDWINSIDHLGKQYKNVLMKY